MNKNLEDTIKYILKDDRIDKEAKKFAIELMYEYHRDELDSELREYLCEQYAGAILELGSAAIPVGGLGKAGAVVGEQALKKYLGRKISKYLGRKISKEIGAGAVSGAVSGAVFGVGRGKMEGENPVVTGVQDALAGGIAGGALGAAAGNIEKAVRGTGIKSTDINNLTNSEFKQYKKQAQNFYKDYLQDMVVKHDKIGEVTFTSKGMNETISKNPDKIRSFPDLERNVSKANYVESNELYKNRKDDIIYFHKLRDGQNEYLIGENKQGLKKFYLSKNNIVNQGLPPREGGASVNDKEIHNPNNLNNNSYIQLSPTMLASGISKSENHIFTREEIAAMSRQEFEANEQAIMEQMRNGQIHSAPKDYSGFVNPQSGDDRIFTREDLRNMKRNEYDENEAAIMAQLNTIGIPTNGELAEAEARNGVVYVRPYTRDDGTEVRGYYRSLPRR